MRRVKESKTFSKITKVAGDAARWAAKKTWKPVLISAVALYPAFGFPSDCRANYMNNSSTPESKIVASYDRNLVVDGRANNLERRGAVHISLVDVSDVWNITCVGYAEESPGVDYQSVGLSWRKYTPDPMPMTISGCPIGGSINDIDTDDVYAFFVNFPDTQGAGSGDVTLRFVGQKTGVVKEVTVDAIANSLDLVYAAHAPLPHGIYEIASSGLAQAGPRGYWTTTGLAYRRWLSGNQIEITGVSNDDTIIARGSNFYAYFIDDRDKLGDNSGQTTEIFNRIFVDVPVDQWAREYISAVANNGITNGCGDGTIYCPEENVTRSQMALFLGRAIGGLEAYTPNECGHETFKDVPCDYGMPGISPSEAYKAIEYITDAKANSIHDRITKGCVGYSRFCPDKNISRAEMALFLARAIGGFKNYQAAPCGQERFQDVGCSYPEDIHPMQTEAYRAIEYIADAANNPVHRQITRGCGDGSRYCPTDFCRRDEMAAFLSRAFLDME